MLCAFQWVPMSAYEDTTYRRFILVFTRTSVLGDPTYPFPVLERERRSCSQKEIEAEPEI